MPLLMSKTSKDGQYLPDHVHVILISDSDSNKEVSAQSVILINKLANWDGLAVTRMVIKIIDLVDSKEQLWWWLGGHTVNLFQGAFAH